MAQNCDDGEIGREDTMNATTTTGHEEQTNAGDPSRSDTNPPFQPTRDQPLRPDFAPQGEQWLNVLSAECRFPPDIFDSVMYNLVRNPNLTSSHLFRADIFYDSDADRLNHAGRPEDGLIRHLRPVYRPIPAEWPDLTLTRTIVRRLIPRNPQLDRPLLQTCHFFSRAHGARTDSLVLYIPHASRPSEVPFYHPCVARLAFHQTFSPLSASSPPNTPSTGREPGTISILVQPFPPSSPPACPSSPTDPARIPEKLHRTSLALLSTLHKHGHGQQAGYVKRVRHDILVPQRRYQETYAALKARHGRALAQGWAEVTDPAKHVFEDLGIAAFLIELWRGMYRDFPAKGGTEGIAAEGEGEGEDGGTGGDEGARPQWRGFVDIGCGNGVLVHVLLSEGCGPGWGFDARERKSWAALGRGHGGAAGLRRGVLVPGILQDALYPSADAAGKVRAAGGGELWHDGVFEDGTFVISNHADQLTLWTPLLAGMNASGFVAIPCCSHDFAGARFRAPAGLRTGGGAGEEEGRETRRTEAPRPGAAEEGSLAKAKEPGKGKPRSAYASLCAYVAALADEVGFVAETETLRIPSTRNICVVGRRRKEGGGRSMNGLGRMERRAMAVEIIERETKRSIVGIAEEWVQRAEGLMKKPGSGH